MPKLPPASDPVLKLLRMRFLLLLSIFFSFLFEASAISAPVLKEIYSDSKTGQKVFWESNPNFHLQIRAIEVNTEEKSIRISSLLSNLGPTISPEQHFGGKVRYIQLTALWLDAQGKELFRKETLPVDYYFQEPGFIRSSNVVSVVISAKGINPNKVDRCILSIELKEQAFQK